MQGEDAIREEREDIGVSGVHERSVSGEVDKVEEDAQVKAESEGQGVETGTEERKVVCKPCQAKAIFDLLTSSVNEEDKKLLEERWNKCEITVKDLIEAVDAEYMKDVVEKALGDLNKTVCDLLK